MVLLIHVCAKSSWIMATVILAVRAVKSFILNFVKRKCVIKKIALLVIIWRTNINALQIILNAKISLGATKTPSKLGQYPYQIILIVFRSSESFQVMCEIDMKLAMALSRNHFLPPLRIFSTRCLQYKWWIKWWIIILLRASISIRVMLLTEWGVSAELFFIV